MRRTVFHGLRDQHHVGHLQGQLVRLLGGVGSDHLHLHHVWNGTGENGEGPFKHFNCDVLPLIKGPVLCNIPTLGVSRVSINSPERSQVFRPHTKKKGAVCENIVLEIAEVLAPFVTSQGAQVPLPGKIHNRGKREGMRKHSTRLIYTWCDLWAAEGWDTPSDHRVVQQAQSRGQCGNSLVLSWHLLLFTFWPRALIHRARSFLKRKKTHKLHNWYGTGLRVRFYFIYLF